MAATTCAEARSVLRQASEGRSLPASDTLRELTDRQAIAGTPERPSITPVGHHVLRELDLRAYRSDSWPLDTLSGELSKILGEIETIARSAEYFLSDLGPITPSEAVPYLRIVSVGLANRRGTPEELAERFRNVWGMVEVMGGDARDRLMGAEVLMATDAAMDSVYAPMMVTVDQLRSFGAKRAVTAASILQLEPAERSPDRLQRWKGARSEVPTDEAAALLATLRGRPDRGAAFEQFRALFEPVPNIAGKVSASLYLASLGQDPSKGVDRILETARLLGPTSRRPLLAAALLTSAHPLSPAELVDWVGKAADAAKRRELAADPNEFNALGVALVEGLPADSFQGAIPLDAESSPLAAAATLLALHAWIYRPLLDPAFDKDAKPVPRAASA
ncbi:MAG TPA: hypothetical protein VGV64_04575 [Thermoplasmata archaeon]|nr:hypothetical protein [Thermoplasmata archaeon]